MTDRHSDITKFSYFSYRSLKKRLGEFDAVVECNEIAIREFIEKSKTTDTKKYIQELSSKHKVKVDEVDFIKFSSRIRQYYVSSVFQQSEQFFADFQEEFKKYNDEKVWIQVKTGETKLHNLLINVFGTEQNIESAISKDIQICYNYYRLVRNYMAHTDRDIKELTKLHNEIISNDNEFLQQLNLSGLPNKYYEINFEDFRFITNIIKHIAYIICINSKPDNERIAQILFEKSKENKKAIYNRIKKTKNDKIRYTNAIENLVKTNFGRFSTKDKLEVTEKLKSLLA